MSFSQPGAVGGFDVTVDRLGLLGSTSSVLIGYIVAAVSIFAIGGIDYVLGSDVHVVSLYFIPLAFAGRCLGRTGALVARKV